VVPEFGEDGMSIFKDTLLRRKNCVPLKPINAFGEQKKKRGKS